MGKSKDYCLFTRYGRIGETGVISYSPGKKEDCISKFRSQFQSKTKNIWLDAYGTPTLTAGNDVSQFKKISR